MCKELPELLPELHFQKKQWKQCVLEMIILRIRLQKKNIKRWYMEYNLRTV